MRPVRKRRPYVRYSADVYDLSCLGYYDVVKLPGHYSGKCQVLDQSKFKFCVELKSESSFVASSSSSLVGEVQFKFVMCVSRPDFQHKGGGWTYLNVHYLT